MPTYTIEPLAGSVPAVGGGITFDEVTEVGGGVVNYEVANQRIAFPENAVIRAISFALTFSGGPTIQASASKISIQQFDTTVTYIYDKAFPFPPGINDFSFSVANDAGLSFGSLPYRAPVDGAFVYVEYDSDDAITITGGLLSIVWSLGGWHAGKAGSGGSW